jgi:hypothetical protein
MDGCYCCVLCCTCQTFFFFFFHSDKIADRDNLRGKGFILAQFQRFQSIVLGSVVSWPVGRQNIMAAGI